MAHHFYKWPLGQAVKTPPFHGGNTGSNPVGVIGIRLVGKRSARTVSLLTALYIGLVVQLVRMPACHAGGRGFESRPDRHLYIKCKWLSSSVGRATSKTSMNKLRVVHAEPLLE
jgi:hypothetical protein